MFSDKQFSFEANHCIWKISSSFIACGQNIFNRSKSRLNVLIHATPACFCLNYVVRVKGYRKLLSNVEFSSANCKI